MGAEDQSTDRSDVCCQADAAAPAESDNAPAITQPNASGDTEDKHSLMRQNVRDTDSMFLLRIADPLAFDYMVSCRWIQTQQTSRTTFLTYMLNTELLRLNVQPTAMEDYWPC